MLGLRQGIHNAVGDILGLKHGRVVTVHVAFDDATNLVMTNAVRQHGVHRTGLYIG